MSPLLTPQAVAEKLAISEATLATWRSRQPDLLPFVRVSARAIRYRQVDVEQFIQDRLSQGGQADG